MTSTTKIIVTYAAVDGYRDRRTFSTLKGAKAFAVERLGENPDFGGGYAVSSDGVGTIQVRGTTIAELFGSAASATKAFTVYGLGAYEDRPGGFKVAYCSVDTLDEAVQAVDALQYNGWYDGEEIVGNTDAAREELDAQRRKYRAEEAARWAAEPLPF